MPTVFCVAPATCTTFARCVAAPLSWCRLHTVACTPGTACLTLATSGSPGHPALTRKVVCSAGNVGSLVDASHRFLPEWNGHSQLRSGRFQLLKRKDSNKRLVDVLLPVFCGDSWVGAGACARSVRGSGSCRSAAYFLCNFLLDKL